jgi:hypothetical protein
MKPLLLGVLALSLALPAAAQQRGGNGNGSTSGSAGYGGNAAGAEKPGVPAGLGGLIPWTTGEAGEKAASALATATQVCRGLPDPAYRIDCLAERLQWVAYKMPQTGAYQQTRKAMEAASARLAATAQSHADPRKARQTYSWGKGEAQRTIRPVVAIRPDQQAAANREATTILDELQTVLLRSSDAQPSVAPEIRQIAAAVGSNKILLRST